MTLIMDVRLTGGPSVSWCMKCFVAVYHFIIETMTSCSTWSSFTTSDTRKRCPEKRGSFCQGCCTRSRPEGKRALACSPASERLRVAYPHSFAVTAFCVCWIWQNQFLNWQKCRANCVQFYSLHEPDVSTSTKAPRPNLWKDSGARHAQKITEQPWSYWWCHFLPRYPGLSSCSGSGTTESLNNIIQTNISDDPTGSSFIANQARDDCPGLGISQLESRLQS